MLGRKREGEGQKYQEANLKEIIKKGQRKETNTESGARRRIFVGVLRSMG